MTKGVGRGTTKGGRPSFWAALPPSVILRSGSPPLPVILRSFAPKNLSDHAPETGGKILRFAQNDKGGWAQNDKGGKLSF